MDFWLRLGFTVQPGRCRACPPSAHRVLRCLTAASYNKQHGLTGDEKKGRELLIRDSCECELELKMWGSPDLNCIFLASMRFLIYVQMCTDNVFWDIVQTQMKNNVTKVAITGEMCCLQKSLE